MIFCKLVFLSTWKRKTYIRRSKQPDVVIILRDRQQDIDLFIVQKRALERVIVGE